MGRTFIKLIRSGYSLDLIKHPNEFTLLSLIAYRAKRTGKLNIHKLEIGESLIGDHNSCGLTRQKYRTALNNLIEWKIITTKTTNKGTIAKIINSDIYDVNVEYHNRQDNQPTTNKPTINQPSDNHQTNHQITTNKNDKKIKNEKNDNIYPEWLDMRLWQEFKKMRTKIKKPLTLHAEKLRINDLKKIIDDGFTQEQIINRSIANCWQDFYKPKTNNGQKGKFDNEERFKHLK